MQTPSDASIGFDPGAVFWSSPSPYLILNPALFVVEVNPAYEQVIQRGRADLVGKYLFDIFPDNPDDPTANGSAIVRNSMQRVLQSGVADNMPIKSTISRSASRERADLKSITGDLSMRPYSMTRVMSRTYFTSQKTSRLG